MTSIGALTTTFTPPDFCSSSTGIYVVGCGGGCEYWAEGPITDTRCYPPDYDPHVNHYYSPGICPSGYTPGCTSRISIGKITETIQTCCPTAQGYSYWCVDPVYPWQESLGCIVYMSESTSTFTWATITSIRNGETTVTSTERSEVGIGAYGIEIRFQSTDLIPTETEQPTSDSSSTAVRAGATQTEATEAETTGTEAGEDKTASSSEPTTDNDGGGGGEGGSGLSAGETAGLAAGVAVGSCALVGIGVIVGRRSVRRWQRRDEAGASGPPAPSAATTTADVGHPPAEEYKPPGNPYGNWYHAWALQAQQPVTHELPVERDLAELQGHGVLQEPRLNR